MYRRNKWIMTDVQERPPSVSDLFRKVITSTLFEARSIAIVLKSVPLQVVLVVRAHLDFV